MTTPLAVRPSAPQSLQLSAAQGRPPAAYTPPQASQALRRRLAAASGPAIGTEVAALRHAKKLTEAEALLAWALGQPRHCDNVFLYNAWLSLTRDDFSKFDHVYGRMVQLGIQHDVFTCCIVIETYGRAGRIERAFAAFYDMQRAGVCGDAAVYSALIKACARADDLSSAWGVFAMIERDGVIADAITYQTLVDLCAQAKDPAKAHSALRAMERAKVRGPASIYNTVMSAYAAAGNSLGVFQVRAAMQRAGEPADTVTYNILLQLCAQEGDCDGTDELWAEMLAEGIAPNVISYTTAIDAHCKAGELAWAEKRFETMRKGKIEPNAHTYAVLLNGYAKAAAASQAWKLFVAMERAGIDAQAPHYGAIVDAHYAAGLYDLGIQRLAARATSMPLSARVGLAELYRKAKRYSEANVTCDQVLANTPQDSEDHHHAWISKNYVAVVSQPQKNHSSLPQPPFSPSSLHWPRYLCLRVFAGVRDADKQAQRAALAAYNTDTRSSYSSGDIRRALSLLDS